MARRGKGGCKQGIITNTNTNKDRERAQLQIHSKVIDAHTLQAKTFSLSLLSTTNYFSTH